VAGFIGAPAMNFIDLRAANGTAKTALGARLAAAGTAAKLGIRPEHMLIAEAGKGDFDATVRLRETLGGDAYLYVTLADGTSLVVRADGDTAIDAGHVIGLTLPPNRLHFFDAQGLALQAGGKPH